MVIKMRFEAIEVTVAMVCLSICPKLQMTTPTKPISPMSPKRSVGWKILMRCQPAVISIPTSVATVVANKIGMNTSVGWAAPYMLR